MTESIPLQVPLIDLQLSSDAAHYVGMLEGTVAALVVNEIKYRTLLELLTGDKWDAAELPQDPNDLMALAVSMISKQTGLDEIKAKSLVAQRFGEVKSKPVIPVETTNVVVAPPVTVPMTDRFKAWKQRQIDLATSGEVS